MGTYTNRYTGFVPDNTPITVPFVEIPIKSTDKYPVYTVGKSRLDKMSDSFYGDPYHGWLILIANPEFRNENEITDGAILRVPFPQNQSKKDYNDALKTHKQLYGE